VPRGQRHHWQTHNWLRVLASAELAQVDHRVCQQLHAIVSLLDAFKTKQQALQRIFPDSIGFSGEMTSC
jgi:hypothetical protein